MNSLQAKQISDDWLRDAPPARLDHVAGVLRRLLPYSVASLVVPCERPGEPPIAGRWQWLEHELLVLGADALHRIAGLEAEADEPRFAVTVRRIELADLRPVQVTDVRTGDHRATHWAFGPSDRRVEIAGDDASGAAGMGRELARRVGWPDVPR